MPSVLIADDNEDLRTMISLVLTEAGYTVFEARHGKEAIEYLSTETIDLVLLDIVMPEMEGIETIRHIASQFSNVPVIMMSGDTAKMSTGPFLKMSKLFGAKETLEKPFELKELLRLVQLHIQE